MNKLTKKELENLESTFTRIQKNIENGIKKKLFDAKEFNNDIVVQILSVNNKTLAVTQNSGVFHLDATRVKPWPISVAKDIKQASKYKALALRDGTL